MFCQVNPSRDSSCNVERGASVKSTDSNDSIEYSMNTDQGVCYETKIIGGVPVKIIKVLIQKAYKYDVLYIFGKKSCGSGPIITDPIFAA